MSNSEDYFKSRLSDAKLLVQSANATLSTDELRAIETLGNDAIALTKKLLESAAKHETIAKNLRLEAEHYHQTAETLLTRVELIREMAKLKGKK